MDLNQEEFWQKEVAKRIERQVIDKQYIDTYLSETI